jgi:hypothetical protein
MRSRRNIVWVAVAIVVIAGGIVTAVLLRSRAAPDAVRLLPESDAVLYVNLEPIRLLTDLGKKPPKERDPQYEEFVRQTGFEFERDLDKAAFAIHYGVPLQGKPAETRYSEILQGHFDSARVSDYLRKLATQVERYRDYDIYDIPVEERTVRVALLGFDTAAASNVDSPEVIHGMIDSYKQAALPFTGTGAGEPVLPARAAGQHRVDDRAPVSPIARRRTAASCCFPAAGAACCRGIVW